MILRALWLRPTLRRPARALATVVGVALGVAAFVATWLASRAAVASMREGVDEIAGRSVLEISRPGGVDEALLGGLRTLCGDALFLPIVEETALAPALGDLVRVVGLDVLVDAPARGVELERGAGEGGGVEKLLLEPSVALSGELARELGLGIGSKLELLVRARKVEVEVAAVFEPARLAPIWRRVLIADVATVDELFGLAGRLDRIEVLPRAALEVEERSALAQRIIALCPAGTRVEPPAERRKETEELFSALEFDLLALAGLSILIGAVLVATALATSVVQRRANIALLRSLGASRVQIARAVLVEAAAIGLAGGALGVAGGWLGARAALASVRATAAAIAAELLPGAVAFEARWFALGAALGACTALAAAWLPLREALRTPPLQALRGESPRVQGPHRWRASAAWIALFGVGALAFASLPPIGRRPVYALLSTLFVLAAVLAAAPLLVDLLAGRRARRSFTGRSAPLALARAALEAGRSRAAWAAGAVGVAVALAASMATMVGSFRSSIVEWTETALRSDLFVRPLPSASGVAAGRLDPEVLDAALALFGADVDPFHVARAEHEGHAIEVGGGDFDVAARRGGLPFLDGRSSRAVFEEARAKRGALVNEPFARRFDVERGDRIALATAVGTIEREVVGVYRSYSSSGGIAVLERADFLAHFPDEGPRSIGIFLAPERDPEVARAELLTNLGGRFALEVLPQRALRAEVLAVFERTFAVTVALELVAAAVAAIAVLTVLYALVTERRRELAVVRALGGSRAQVVLVVIGQAGLLGLGGACTGLAAGALIGVVLVKVVNVQSFGWSMRLAFPFGAFAGLLAAVVIAALVAGLAPALAAARLAPREVLREDG